MDSSHWSSTLEHIVLLIVSDNSQSSSVGLGAEDLLNCFLILILEYNNRQLSASRVASGPESASFLVVLTNGIEGVLKPVLEVIPILLPDLSPYLKGRSLLTVTEVVEEPKRDIVRNVVVDVVLSQEELLKALHNLLTCRVSSVVKFNVLVKVFSLVLNLSTLVRSRSTAAHF